MTVFLLSVLGFGKSAVSCGLQWLSRRSLAEIGCIALACVIVVQHLALVGEKRHSAKLAHQVVQISASREADRRAYAKAQADAAAANKAQVAKIEQQQQKVTDDVEARYRADLARLRMQSANRAPSGAASDAGPSAPSSPASGPNGQAVPLPSAELLRAQETELQLNALIDWVLGQSSVDPNTP
jgi:hypothetical protein